MVVHYTNLDAMAHYTIWDQGPMQSSLLTEVIYDIGLYLLAYFNISNGLIYEIC